MLRELKIKEQEIFILNYHDWLVACRGGNIDMMSNVVDKIDCLVRVMFEKNFNEPFKIARMHLELEWTVGRFFNANCGAGNSGIRRVAKRYTAIMESVMTYLHDTYATIAEHEKLHST
jgi:hypothetical protein